ILYLLLFTSCGEQVINPEKLNVIPPVFPDYIGVTVPASITPLNFVLSIPYDKIDVTISGKKESFRYSVHLIIYSHSYKQRIEYHIKLFQCTAKENDKKVWCFQKNALPLPS
ncbi:MAG: hypothetical protein WAU22_02960, partial [Segatella copri]